MVGLKGKVNKIISIILIAAVSVMIFASCKNTEQSKIVPEKYKTEDWSKEASYNPDTDIATIVYNLHGEKPLKILQLTDIHYDDHNSRTEYREKVLGMVENLIMDVKPHIVTVTGDWGSNSFNLLEGEKEKYASMYPDIQLDENTKKGQTIKGLRQARSRELFDIIHNACESVDAVWAPVFGNHDAEGDMSKYDYADLFAEYSTCIFKTGYQNLKGVGNYIIAVNENGKLTRAIYMLDSHSAVKYGSTKYDFLGDSQIEWFSKTNSELTKRYKQDGGAEKYIPSAIYQHIALTEYATAYDKAVSNQNLLLGGNREKVSKPYKNTGMFNAMIKAGGAQAVFCGHDHDNTSASMYKGIILAYGVSTGWCDEYATGAQKGAMIATYQGSKIIITHRYMPIFDFADSII